MRCLLIVCFLSNIMWSQNLDVHQWKNRVIIISADNANSNLAESQWKILTARRDKLKDRKIVIYKCIDNNCVFYNEKIESTTVKIEEPAKGFQTVLVGLDGGKKFTSKKVEKPSVFFDLIDTMPMRRQELKNKKYR